MPDVFCRILNVPAAIATELEDWPQAMGGRKGAFAAIVRVCDRESLGIRGAIQAGQLLELQEQARNATDLSFVEVSLRVPTAEHETLKEAASLLGVRLTHAARFVLRAKAEAITRTIRAGLET